MFKPKMTISFFILLLAVLTIFSYSASSTIAYAESGGMVGDCLGENKDSKQCTEAQKEQPTTTATTGTSGLGVWDYTKIVLSLIFVVALLYGVLKLVNRNNKKYQSNQLLQSLGGLSLGQHKSIQLVKIGSSLFVIGVGDDVHIIKEITDEQEQHYLLKLHEDKQVLASQLPYIAELVGNMKDKFSQKKNRSKSNEQVGNETGDFKSELDKKLHQIKKERQNNMDEWQQKENKDNE
ncbi:flagellar biosynthetic protein FliO [Kurthia sibirica]|uniref:Flagellar protein n=1 Tax=Kurthia sibirica TaxID=202750 RepID=A0A2U3AQU2_9BACL|nr:flagellar biosynthetic protein FliO [Kurthia sibirica]PWI26907.1 flagellar protein [Kurthia sibirica]GEK32551.1 flagellar biosynthetic protein FliZ [Kurthia sibirica]